MPETTSVRSIGSPDMTDASSAGFLKEEIKGARPCKSYHGYATAVLTYNGTPVVVMAATHHELKKVCMEICQPNVKIEATKFIPANLIHDQYIIRDDI